MHKQTDNGLLRDVEKVLLAPDNVRNRLLDHYVKTGELDISYAHGRSPSPTLERNAILLTYYSAALAGGMMPPEWVFIEVIREEKGKEERKKERKEGRKEGILHILDSEKTHPPPPPPPPPPGRNRASGAQVHATSAEAAEGDVFKSIMVREGLLQRAINTSENLVNSDTSSAEIPGSSSYALMSEVVALCDKLRTAGVQVVEAMERWKRLNERDHAAARVESGAKDTPFIYNGVNYLIKMVSDCNFLKLIPPLCKTLCKHAAFTGVEQIPMLRNPLFFVHSIDSDGSESGALRWYEEGPRMNLRRQRPS